jgi:ankyrin repeat protein
MAPGNRSSACVSDEVTIAVSIQKSDEDAPVDHDDPVYVLQSAIGLSDVAAVRRLLKEGADLEHPDDDGCTPLFYAVLVGEPSVLRVLLEAGADPNAVAPEPGCTLLADTPLHLAEQCAFLMDKEKYERVVDMLRVYGAR